MLLRNFNNMRMLMFQMYTSLALFFFIDEVNSENSTGLPTCHEYICLEEGLCVPYKKICDGYFDCYDGTDELGCSATQSYFFVTEQMSVSTGGFIIIVMAASAVVLIAATVGITIACMKYCKRSALRQQVSPLPQGSNNTGNTQAQIPPTISGAHSQQTGTYSGGSRIGSDPTQYSYGANYGFSAAYGPPPAAQQGSNTAQNDISSYGFR